MVAERVMVTGIALQSLLFVVISILAVIGIVAIGISTMGTGTLTDTEDITVVAGTVISVVIEEADTDTEGIEVVIEQEA